MSLFNETYARATKAEDELDRARSELVGLRSQVKQLNERVAGLQEDLARERRARTAEVNREYAPSVSLMGLKVGRAPERFAMNSLSENDVEELFKAHKYYDGQEKAAKVAKQVDAADLKSAGESLPMSVRSRLLAPIAKLLSRNSSATTKGAR